jgi:hypothetical protein
MNLSLINRPKPRKSLQNYYRMCFQMYLKAYMVYINNRKENHVLNVRKQEMKIFFIVTHVKNHIHVLHLLLVSQLIIRKMCMPI